MATVTPPATRIRFRVAALGTGLAMLTYLDRTAMGTIAPVVTKEWHLTPSETGWIFTAFALAYAIFEIPTAKWAEKLGQKRCSHGSSSGGRCSPPPPAPPSIFRRW
jgi:MFS family permease